MHVIAHLCIVVLGGWEGDMCPCMSYVFVLTFCGTRRVHLIKEYLLSFGVCMMFSHSLFLNLLCSNYILGCPVWNE